MDVQQLIRMSNELEKLYIESGVLSVDTESVHLSEDSFLNNLKVFNVRERDCEVFNREVYAIIDNVRFFAIMSEEDFQVKVRGENEKEASQEVDEKQTEESKEVRSDVTF